MQTLLAWLQLCRFAAVFTAMADIFLGYLLVHPRIEGWLPFGWLLGASSCLYLAGMVFNDVFDREIDRVERPRRPIPSGRVSLTGAVVFGAALVATGLATAVAAGRNSALVAVILTTCIFAYDSLVKSTPAGPVVMGACRFLNVIFGASTAASLESGEPSLAAVWSLPQLHVAGALAVYIAGVTWFARKEAIGGSRTQLAAAAGTVNLGLALLAGFLLNWPDRLGRSSNALIALALVAVVANRRLVGAIVRPEPAQIQSAVRTMLLWLVMLDATVVFFIQPDRNYWIAVMLLMVPAQILARFLAVT
jgi:4-hydroxybenzoate polyprenyltransferase